MCNHFFASTHLSAALPFQARKLAVMAIVLPAITAHAVVATTIVFNSDTGTIELDGTAVTSLHGTPFTTTLDTSTGIRRRRARHFAGGGQQCDPTFRVDLLQGGYAANPLFGGTGRSSLDSLRAFEVYATLIPDTGTLFNASIRGVTPISAHLNNGEFAFLTGSPAVIPEPATLTLSVWGLATLVFAGRWRKKK